MNDTARMRPAALALIPPPLLFAAALATGLLIDRRLPLPLPASAAWPWVAVTLIAAGVAHVFTSIALFALKRTTIIPHRRSSAFVVGGAYRWTRNPMYVGVTVMYLGICVFARTIWPVLLLPLPLLAMDRKVIPMEERQLEAAFGDAYLAYKTRVRRWL